MTRVSLRNFLCLAIWASAAAAAQSPPHSAPDAPSTVIHADTSLVVVDVVVTDAHQNPIRYLTASDFVLREDGKPQALKSFEEHGTEEAATVPRPPTPSQQQPGTFTNDSPIPASGPLDIILLDKLNSPLADQSFCQDQVSKFLQSVPAGATMAVVNLNSSQLSLLQGFTTDLELLRAAIKKKEASVSPPIFLTTTPAGGVGPSGAMAERTKLNNQFRRQLTLDAINLLGRYLGQLSGRKNLLWCSSSFPIAIQPDGLEPADVLPGFVEEFHQTVDLLAHSQVSVYPMDAHGLNAEPWFGAPTASGNSVLANITTPSTSMQAFASQNASRQTAMTEIAEATGGKAFLNTNSIKDSIAHAIETGSNYYALTYSPENHDWKGQYRKIQVELARKGLTLVYRRGYYATDPNAPVEHKKLEVQAGNPQPFSAMRAAMVRGGPEPTEIRFKALVRPAVADPEQALAKGNQGTEKAQGPFRRYNVHYYGHLGDIQCPPASSGELLCTLEFVARVYDANGVLINTQDNRFEARVKPENYAALQKPGNHPEFQYRQDISVPAKGEYYLRLGIHDVASDRVGAVELPIAAVSSLPALSASNAPANPPAKSN